MNTWGSLSIFLKFFGLLLLINLNILIPLFQTVFLLFLSLATNFLIKSLWPKTIFFPLFILILVMILFLLLSLSLIPLFNVFSIIFLPNLAFAPSKNISNSLPIALIVSIIYPPLLIFLLYPLFIIFITLLHLKYNTFIYIIFY